MTTIELIEAPVAYGDADLLLDLRWWAEANVEAVTAVDALEAWLGEMEDKVKDMRADGAQPLASVLTEATLLVGQALSLQEDEAGLEGWTDQIVPGWRVSY